MKKSNFLGKKTGTRGLNNWLWIKKFENGVKIRKKEEGEITLNVSEIFELLLYLRKYPKTYDSPIFLTSLDLIYAWQKYPETQEFIERLLMDEVSDEEKLKIHNNYMKKIHLLDNL